MVANDLQEDRKKFTNAVSHRRQFESDRVAGVVTPLGSPDSLLPSSERGGEIDVPCTHCLRDKGKFDKYGGFGILRENGRGESGG